MKRLRLASGESPPPFHIPDELIREILLSLPVKSLVRFTCVCKCWKHIISNPQFVKHHLRRSFANTARLPYTRLLFDSHAAWEPFKLMSMAVPLLFFSSQNQNGHELYQIENEYILAGVCNGMVSLIKRESTTSDTNQFYFSLWNPATRLRSQLSPPLYLSSVVPCNSDTFVFNYGFGYDCLNDTYKVVAMVKIGIEVQQQTVVKIYEMGSSCWRTIESFAMSPMNCSSKGVYAKGTLNWVSRIINTHVYVIASLDMRTEEFSQLSLPNSCQHAKTLRDPILQVLKDCLCILHNDGDMRFLIWLMKDFEAQKSWIQIFNIDFEQDIFRRVSFLAPNGFILSENDEVLLISNYEHHDLVLYNKRENTFKFNSARGHRVYRFMVSWNVENYVESLVSPC